MKNKTKDTFSLLHTNICSLQFNGDNLQNLLASLEHKFDIVALSETWNLEYKKHTFCPPVIEGCSSYKGTTGSSLKGGCGLYISDELKPLARPDLNVKIKDGNCEFETYWTEIIIDKQPNRLIGVLYRHPSRKNDEKCIVSLNETLTNIRKENQGGQRYWDILEYTGNT